MRSKQLVPFGIGVIALAFAAGCGGNKSSAPKTAEAPPPADTSMTPAAGMTPETTEPATAPPATTSTPEAAAPATPKVETLKDAQIVSIVAAANQAEIDQAKIAMKKAKNARVKKFAAMMIQHHTDAKGKQEKLSKKLALQSEDSTTLSDLKSGADSAMSKINSATGADFDSAYIDTQVTEHQALLDAIDNKLMNQAQAGDLKTLLTDIRPVVEKHLTEAKDIQQLLASGGGTAGATGTTGKTGTGAPGTMPKTGTATTGGTSGGTTPKK